MPSKLFSLPDRIAIADNRKSTHGAFNAVNDAIRAEAQIGISLIRSWEELMVEIRSNEPPGLVLLNVDLSDSGGREFIARSSGLHKLVPTIVMHDPADDETMNYALECGHQDFIATSEVNSRSITHRYSIACGRSSNAPELLDENHRDPVTKALTATLFADRFEHAIASACRNEDHLTLLLLNIDHFDEYNNRHGFDAGDDILEAVAARLSHATRTTDTVGRLGGDTFAVVLEGIKTARDAVDTAVKTYNSITTMRRLEDPANFPTASGGVVVFEPKRNKSLTASTLMRRAELALERAKRRGRDQLCIFTDGIDHRLNERVTFEREIARAVDNGEFVTFFQGIFPVGGQSPCGVEALMRWIHPERGLIMPDRTLPVLERMNLDSVVCRETLRYALQQFAPWQSELTAIGLSYNVSASELLRKDFVSHVESTLTDAGVDPNRVQFEITEHALLDSSDAVERNIHRLRWLGIGIVVDDFGMGYGSFSYLRRFPIKGVKIDRAVISGIQSNPTDLAIAQSIVTLARCAGMTVTAEGIESEELDERSSQLDVDYVQGFYNSKPLPADAFAAQFALPCAGEALGTEALAQTG